MKNEQQFLHELHHAQSKETISSLFPELFEQINELFKKISLCDSLTIAAINFDRLEEIHLVMTQWIYKKNIELPPVLAQFFKNFERIDDPEQRAYWFNEIKQNSYHLDFETFFLEDIHKHFARIKTCTTLAQAEPIFHELADIQQRVALLICKEHKPVSKALRTFFSDFDRLDLPRIREYLFNAIRTGNYDLN